MHIELERVSKRFGPRGEIRALEAVSTVLDAGKRAALIGPNGSGKSTLIRSLLGLVAHEGAVRIDGRPVRPEELARRTAYVPQVAPQAAAPVGDFLRAICTVRSLAPEAVVAAAAGFGLDLEDLRRRPLRSLSGGTKQKLLLSVAFATPAELFILDEPTASLDARARAAFFARVAELPPAATLVLCSHRLEEIHNLVDSVLMLEEGRLVYDAPAHDLLAARSASVLSCLVDGDGDGDGAWLQAAGFARGAGGWWARTVSRAEKLKLLPAALAALSGLRDVQVRELDTLEMNP
jgi:ABC-type multidrug transport system ATPase subunit